MANENNNTPTPKQNLIESLTRVCAELWNEASAAFATKEEAGADNYSALTGRVSDLEAIINAAGAADADNIINKVSEMIAFFSGIVESDTLAGLLASLKQELEAEIPTSMTWDSITGKPSTYTPSAHTHSVSDLTDYDAPQAAFVGETLVFYSGGAFSGETLVLG